MKPEEIKRLIAEADEDHLRIAKIVSDLIDFLAKRRPGDMLLCEPKLYDLLKPIADREHFRIERSVFLSNGTIVWMPDNDLEPR